MSVTDDNKSPRPTITNRNTTQALLDDLKERGYELWVNERGRVCSKPDPPVTPVIWHAIAANHDKLVRLLSDDVMDTNSRVDENVRKDNTDWSKVADLKPARGEEFDRALAEYRQAFQAASEAVEAAEPKEFVEGMVMHWREMDKRRSGRDREAQRRIEASKKGEACGKCGTPLEDGERVYVKCRVYAGMAGGLMSRPGPRFENRSVCEGCAPKWMAKPKEYYEYTIGDKTVRVPEARRIGERPCDTCERPAVFERTPRRNYYGGRVFCSYRCEYTYHNRRRSQREQHLREKVCEVCGESFTATRAHAKTCSPGCKQKAYRMRKKQEHP